MKQNTDPSIDSRREFLKRSSLAVAASVAAPYISLSGRSFAAGDDTLKVGLIGSGGRGTGAASQALHADKKAVLTAVADVFENKVHSSLRELQADKETGERAKVEESHQFVGLDDY